MPTLFQSLIGPGGQSLRAVMRPVHTSDMDDDFARGIALRAQFASVDWPRDTALVVDAPGPSAVAIAAALADHFAPVFTFANWPHPLGVVPAHQTLAAALYYLPMLAAAQAVRPPDAPPVFVLDSNRLAPYGDADTQFDNRYFVKLPNAEQLAALGVRHVLYVGAEPRELDDLNAALVALCQHGVDVKMVALGDFVRAGDEPALAQEEGAGDEGDGGDEGDAGDVGDEPAPLDAAWAWGFAWAESPMWWPHFWYRGCWWDGGLFWHDYPFHHPHGGGVHPPHHRGAVVVGPPHGTRMPPLPTHAAWTPRARSTLFTPLPGLRHSVGQVAVRAARSDGHIVAVRAGSTAFVPGGARFGGGGFHGALRSSSVAGIGHSEGRFGGAGHSAFAPSGGGPASAPSATPGSAAAAAPARSAAPALPASAAARASASGNAGQLAAKTAGVAEVARRAAGVGSRRIRRFAACSSSGPADVALRATRVLYAAGSAPCYLRSAHGAHGKERGIALEPGARADVVRRAHGGVEGPRRAQRDISGPDGGARAKRDCEEGMKWPALSSNVIEDELVTSGDNPANAVNAAKREETGHGAYWHRSGRKALPHRRDDTRRRSRCAPGSRRERFRAGSSGESQAASSWKRARRVRRSPARPWRPGIKRWLCRARSSGRSASAPAGSRPTIAMHRFWRSPRYATSNCRRCIFAASSLAVDASFSRRGRSSSRSRRSLALSIKSWLRGRLITLRGKANTVAFCDAVRNVALNEPEGLPVAIERLLVTFEHLCGQIAALDEMIASSSTAMRRVSS